MTVSGFEIAQTEVTAGLWLEVMGSLPYGNKDSEPNKPVVNVSWYDCQEFILKFNALTGRKFRPPTEAEWEYAARGGNRATSQTLYSGSNVIGDVAWYYSNSSSSTHEVAGKAANVLGFFDMSGNVYEWCNDWYGSYSSSQQTNPTGPTSGSNRVLRGGSWYNGATYCRVSNRIYNSVTFRFNNSGMRLALTVE